MSILISVLSNMAILYFDRISKFIETGLFYSWLMETLLLFPEKVLDYELSSLNMIRNINVSDIQSVFYIYFLIIVTSIVAFISEIIQFCVKYIF